VSSPRAVRIVRTPGPRASVGPAAAAPAAAAGAESSATGAVDRRRNQAATERAYRLTTIFVGTLVGLYVLFVVLDRLAPGGSSSAVETGLLSFSGIAAAIGVVGALVAISPAPRAIEVRPDALVVIEWWGHRRSFPPVGQLQMSVLRRYPASFLSSRPVEAVEVGTRASGRKVYQFEAGLLPELVREPRIAGM
jgi:hypothetical protein